MENTPTLHTEHLTLDRFTLEDVPAVRDTLYTEAVCRNLFITPNKTTEEVTENIQWLLDGYETKEDFHQWAVRENGLCVGRVMLTVSRRFHTGTVAYYLAESTWGKGYMTEILKRVFDFCFDDLGTIFERIYGFSSIISTTEADVSSHELSIPKMYINNFLI